MKGMNRDAVRELLDISERLFGEDNIFPVDGGAVLQRTIQTENKINAQQDFSEWFYANIISNMLVNDDYSIEKRVFILSGRAGQGKSTMLRHIFLHLKNQETTDARLRPNFTRKIDENLGTFFREYQDQVHYYQAREMPEASFSVGKHKQLVLIDGLDEASENQIGTITETIIANPKSFFLLSSRSKSDPEPGNPAHQEVINANVLSKYLQKKGERFNPENSSAFLSPMTLREKKSMMTLIEEHDEGRKYNYLSTLVENDSQIIQRPADFLVYRAKNPNTKSEYYLEHLRWLLERERTKGEVRKTLVDELEFPKHDEFDLLNSNLTNKARLFFKKDIDKKIKSSLDQLNLLESSGTGFYLDLSTPASRALVLLSTSAKLLNAPELRFAEDLDIQSMLESYLKTELFKISFTNAIEQHSDGPLYDFSFSLLNGYTKHLMTADVFPATLDPIREHDDFKIAMNRCLWLADVTHPIDELAEPFILEPISEPLSELVTSLIGEEDRISEQLSSKEWFENRLESFMRLSQRLAQIGPSSTKRTAVSPEQMGELKFPETILDPKSDLFRRIYQLVYDYGVKYGEETKNYSYHKLREFIPKEPKRLNQNLNSQGRTLLTCLYYATIKEDRNKIQFSRAQMTKFHFFMEPLLLNARYPQKLKLDGLIKYGNEDLLFTHLKNMGYSSQYADDVVSFFINLGISPSTKYTNFDLKRNRHSDKDYYNPDHLLRSVKFLNMIERESHSPYLRSIIHAMVVVSRMSHLLPRNNYGMYKSNLGSDVGQLMFNNRDGGVLEKYIQKQKENFRFIDNEAVPPTFIDRYTRDKEGALQKENKVDLQNSLLDKKFPTIDLKQSPIPENIVKMLLKRLDVLAKSPDIEPFEFAEYFAATAPFFYQENKMIIPAEYNQKLFQALIDLIQKGELFPALFLAIRTSQTDVLSVLVECELSEDGFNHPKSSLVGNYLHRRVLADNLHAHYPNNSEFARGYFIMFCQEMSRLDDNTILKKHLQEIDDLYQLLSPRDSKTVENPHESRTFVLELWNVIKKTAGTYIQQVMPLPKKPISMYLEGTLPGEPTEGIKKRFGSKNIYLPRKIDFMKVAQLKEFTALSEKERKRLIPEEGEGRPQIKEILKLFGSKDIYAPWLIDYKKLLRLKEFNALSRQKRKRLLPTIELTEISYNSLMYNITTRPHERAKIDLMKVAELKEFTALSEKERKRLIPTKEEGYPKIEEIYKLFGSKDIYLPRQYKKWNTKIEIALVDVIHNDLHEKRKRQLKYEVKLNGKSITYDGYESYITDAFYRKNIIPEIIGSSVEEWKNEFGNSKESSPEYWAVQFFEWWIQKLENEEFNPVKTDYSLAYGNTNVMRSWHTEPYFSDSDVISTDPNKPFSMASTNDMKKGEFILHLLQDELILPGENLPLELDSKANEYTLLNELKFRIHHSKTPSFDSTSGSFALTKDPIYHERLANPSYEKWDVNTEQDDEIIASLGLRSHPPGLRSLNRFLDVFEDNYDDEQELSQDYDDVFFASSRISSIKHRFVVKPSDSEIVTEKSLQDYSYLIRNPDIEPEWCIFEEPYSKFNNPVYGVKFGLNQAEVFDQDCIEGFAEFKYLRFSSNEPRKVCTTFVEVSNEYFTNTLTASPKWKSVLLFSKLIQLKILEANSQGQTSRSAGQRVDRVFGIICNTGHFDPHILSQINASLDKLDVNVQQLKAGSRVKSGRTNLISVAREISCSFLYSNWESNYWKTFCEIKKRFILILSEIEEAETSIVGMRLPGTERDIAVIRAILSGVEEKYNQHLENLEQECLELLNRLENKEVPLKEFKKKMKVLSHHLDENKIRRIKDVAIKSFDEGTINRYCRRRINLEVRVLGMPQSSYPFSLSTDWSETVGTLSNDHENCKVGSLVRLDLKHKSKGGTVEAMVANIAYARDELDEDGNLLKEYNDGEENVCWPEPLPKSTWLPLSMTSEQVCSMDEVHSIPLHIKSGMEYATHPSLAVEIPIFIHPQDAKSVSPGELRNCTIGIRRDRTQGLFRYYVTHIG